MSTWYCRLGVMKSIWHLKSEWWLSIRSKMQILCMWSSWGQCHSIQNSFTFYVFITSLTKMWWKSEHSFPHKPELAACWPTDSSSPCSRTEPHRTGQMAPVFLHSIIDWMPSCHRNDVERYQSTESSELEIQHQTPVKWSSVRISHISGDNWILFTTKYEHGKIARMMLTFFVCHRAQRPLHQHQQQFHQQQRHLVLLQLLSGHHSTASAPYPLHGHHTYCYTLLATVKGTSD